MKYWQIGVLSWLTSVQLSAAEPFHLQLVPNTCITTEQQPQCSIKLRLTLTGGSTQAICIQLANQPKQCQQHLSKTTSEFWLQVDTLVDLPIVLTNDTGQVLQQTQLQLVRYQSPSKRHKRGYVWNLL
jgi:hypothetical protein